MMNILIVEDEIYIQKLLETLITKIDQEINIVGKCSNAADAAVVTQACSPDLVLLDINLKGSSGFDFLQQTTHLDFELIFITAYEEYALQAIKNGALDYILKPLDETELKQALDKAKKIIALKNQTPITSKPNNKKRLIIKLQDQIQMIWLEDLLYCSSDKGYTTFHLSNQKKITSSKPINFYETQLPKKQFFRTHQSYIVNLFHIKSYDKVHSVNLSNQENIPVSVRRKELFLEWLEKENT